ncbi:diacylglycerol/lipid kinase family protein [Secundilactobacillus similis]|uniref:Transcriptional regulator n=1 Tax=Secundilactobacillus similis DSM 23365 = JCM 2765 TaxID=1423804 RepID=A0A0R2EZE4_9LACO|nr:YegS/Rv2252/BmrU family lipid kinase [Secundilactobacillus similis]KRN21730.1 transcriptional regulator [Secundilactobacillus similis DSM 23365 = JCM 2765]
MLNNVELIINPVAGNGKTARLQDQLIEQLQPNCLTLHTQHTQYPGHAQELASQLTDAADTIVVVFGGDGTLHEVVNGLHQAHLELPVGYIPTGTGNDFARAHGISQKPLIALNQLLTAQATATAIGLVSDPKLGEIVFINNLGIGIDANIVYQTNHSKIKGLLNKLKLGNMSYAANLLKAIRHQQPFQLTWQARKDHQLDHAYLCVFTNHPYFGGGVQLLSDRQNAQAGIHLVMVEKTTWRKLIPVIGSIYAGRSLNHNIHTADHDTFHLLVNSPQHIQIDGEEAMAPVNATIKQINQTFLLPVS